MARQNQETITMFGEVLHSSNISYSQNRSSSNDNRLMIYFQGMKVYIPDNFQPDTLLKRKRLIFRYDRKNPRLLFSSRSTLTIHI